MDDWNEIMEGQAFITDLGGTREAEVEGRPQTLERYAVWSPVQGGTGHTVVEVGGNLEELMGRYHIASDRVCILAVE